MEGEGDVMGKARVWPAFITGVGLMGVVINTWADVPPLNNSFATTAATEPASVYSLPNGEGDSLTACYAFGGGRLDATITVFVRDGNDDPVYLYPAEDIWLADECCLVICPAGTIADSPTDTDGVTTITGPFLAGGSTQEDVGGAMVLINGDALPQPAFEITFNSADIDGDLAVNITDIVYFVDDYLVEYRYRSDFHWDGVINLSDLVLLAEGLGAHCP